MAAFHRFFYFENKPFKHKIKLTSLNYDALTSASCRRHRRFVADASACVCMHALLMSAADAAAMQEESSPCCRSRCSAPAHQRRVVDVVVSSLTVARVSRDVIIGDTE